MKFFLINQSGIFIIINEFAIPLVNTNERVGIAMSRDVVMNIINSNIDLRGEIDYNISTIRGIRKGPRACRTPQILGPKS